MISYMIRRALQGFLTLAAVLVAIFVVVRASGDPAVTLLPPDATNEDVEELREWLGLNDPLYVQLGVYVKNLATGDFGDSLKNRRPVAPQLLERGINTLKLGVIAVVFGMGLAVPLGIVAAVKRGTSLETVAKLVALAGQSLPPFWVAILLILVFSVWAEFFPAGGMGGVNTFILPGFTLALFMMAGVVRLLRSSMLEVLDSEFVKFARSKGVSPRAVIWKHALRNALLPVVSFGGLYVAIFLTGSIITETVFAWPGLGRLLYTGLIARDFPIVQAVVVVMVAVTIAVNLMVDILYAYLDPRIRLA